MKYITGWLILGLSLFSNTSKACDVCGCSSMSFGLGDWANQGRSLLGTSYTLREFQGPTNRDYFHQIQWNGIWAIDESWQLKLSLPFILAQREIEESGEKKRIENIGDLSLNLQKRIWSQINSNSIHNLYLSLGLQLPSGKFENRPIESLFAPNFQAGSASWDILSAFQYEFAWKRLLFVLQGAFLKNTVNRYHYTFGDQWQHSLKVARRIEFAESTSMLSFLNLDYEYLGRDINSRGYYQYGSGGQAWFLGAGLQFNHANWSFGLQYQSRPWQAYGEYQAKQQFNLNLSYFL